VLNFTHGNPDITYGHSEIAYGFPPFEPLKRRKTIGNSSLRMAFG